MTRLVGRGMERARYSGSDPIVLSTGQIAETVGE